MNRTAMLDRALERREPWDFIVIGGGATGAGVALDAATRGYSVLLLEQHDFGKGTSSRSTKLIHGGVRYLAQGNVTLVREALRERGLLLRNAPDVVHNLTLIVPAYRWWEKSYYALGMIAYDQLAGSQNIGRSRGLSRHEALLHLPNLKPAGLRGGVAYHDGQFDDARLLVQLLRTAVEASAVVLNYAPVTALAISNGRVNGVLAHDAETGREIRAAARIVVNATGAFCDSVRKLADASATPLVAPSQGAHLVFDRSFLPGDAALLVPKTPDGRVLFAIPWHGHTLVGTTDVAIQTATLEPRPSDSEIDYILETAGRYLAKAPTRTDILSMFAGIRPLVGTSSSAKTSKLSREHLIHFDQPGLLTITGGKWTTFRVMAEDCVDAAAELAGLPQRECTTARRQLTRADSVYSGGPLHSALPYTEGDVARAVREEMAQCVEDVLSRRTRCLLLNAEAAIEVAPRVAALMARELGRDHEWIANQVREFAKVAKGYMV